MLVNKDSVASSNRVASEEHAAQCEALTSLLQAVGDKWSVRVIAALSEEAMRPKALMERIDGISQRMLTLTLRNLEEAGLVARAVQAAVPPSVVYSLTEKG